MPLSLKECVTIDAAQLHDEFMRIPADYAYYSQQYADAKRVYLLDKMERGSIWARIRLETRETLTMQGERVTEARLDTEAEINEEYCDAKRKEIMSEVEMVKLYGILEAIKTKREMLISLGAHIRQEMKTV
jgi:hypothetical protein